MNVLEIYLYQCTSWRCCERLRSALVSFSEGSFNMFAHFTMGDLQAHLSKLCWVFSSFWPEVAGPPCRTLLFNGSRTPSILSLFPQMKKRYQGKHFANVKEVKQEKAKHWKASLSSRTVLSSGKKSLLVFCIKWRVLWRWLKFKHVRINTKFFNK